MPLRILRLFLVVAVFFFPAFVARVSSADQKTDAEKLFQALNDKLTKTKSLNCSFEIIDDMQKAGESIKGVLLLAEGDKARIELKGKFIDVIMLSDGKNMVNVHGGVKDKERPTPKGLNARVLGMIDRAGIFSPMLIPNATPGDLNDVKIEDLLKVSDLKLGKAEKVNDVECQSLEFVVAYDNGKGKFTCIVWLDPKTNHPVKRTITITDKKESAKITEIWTKVEFDGKIDAAKFELPK